jgi:hypothetical protein
MKLARGFAVVLAFLAGLLAAGIGVAWILTAPAALPEGGESAARLVDGPHHVGRVELEWMERLVDLLSSTDVFFVGLHCPLPELERREQARGDRRAGEARADFRALRGFAEYDLELDSTEPLDDNVAQLVSSWRSRELPSAFQRMAKRA